jgi:RNA polymerase sigma-70 factor (ECF subfamily)
MLKPHLNPHHISDIELLAQIKAGNHDAFDILYKRYWATLVNTAFKRVGCQQKAEDLVQDIFIGIYRRRDALQITTSFAAYLQQALKYSILNEIRDKLVREKFLKTAFIVPDCKNDLAKALELKELSAKIDHTLNNLPPKCKEAFLLSRREHQPYKEISMHLSISVSTVEKHIVKALRILRANFND